MHYRAPPDIRGSGKERGHGTELKYCPKCGKELKPGKHHVGCTAGKSAPRQAAKRQRQMSTTTESEMDWQTTTEDTVHDGLVAADTGSWQRAVRRQAQRYQQGGDQDSIVQPIAPGSGSAAGQDSCRFERMQHEHGDLVFTSNAMADYGLLIRPGEEQQTSPRDGRPVREAALRGMEQRLKIEEAEQDHSTAAGTASKGGKGSFYGIHPTGLVKDSVIDLLQVEGVHFAGEHGVGMEEGSASDLLRVPSPPPLPEDWDIGGPAGMLFDFDQFDLSKRSQPVRFFCSISNLQLNKK